MAETPLRSPAPEAPVQPLEIEQEVDLQSKAPAAAPNADEFEIEVEPDPLYKKPDWKTDPAAQVDDPSDKDYGDRVQKRIGKLRASLTEAAKQRDKAAREREEAIALARGYMGRIAELENTLNHGTASYLDRQIETEEARSKLAENALRQSLTVGDADAIAKANADLANSAAALAQLRTAANFRKSQLAQQAQQAPQPVQPRQPVSAVEYPQAPKDPMLDAWVAKNSWFQADEEMTQTALELHDELAAKGVRVGSPRYYQLLDAGVQEKFPDYFGATETRSPRPASPLAPSVRTSTGQRDNTTNPNRIKLTSSQVATAARLGLTPQQYAKELVRLRKEGADY